MIEPADLEIHEVTTGTLLLTETSPTTESIALLKPGINPGKYEHPCQVEDFEPRWTGSTTRNPTNLSMMIGDVEIYP